MTSTSRFRPEIQALRAIAVVLVVIYHVWPTRLTGGYVGVDVFFVISGFLITAHLLNEALATGTVSLTHFWSRRIRRLLPAAFVVLAVSLVAALIWIPDSLIQQNVRDIAASSLYVVNWVLAADATDYLASESLPSIVQHFWSLSVEEQFYIAWPILLVVSGLVARAVSRRTRAAGAVSVSTVFFAVLIAVFAASLVFSIVLTITSPALAYFSTVTRAWEFAAGALLAVAVSRWPMLGLGNSAARVPLGIATSCLGLALIAVAALTFDDATAFPGWLAALPVGGAVLLIAGSGVLDDTSPLIRVAAVAPVQRIGDWSYSIYLWHWPLIALYPYMFGTSLAGWHAVVVIALSVALAAATKYLVEDPIRTGRWWRANRRRAFALAAGALVFVVVASVHSAAIDARKAEAQEWAQAQLSSGAECFGARAMDPSSSCSGRFILSASTDLAFAATDLDPDWCLAGPLDDEVLSCEYGDTTGFSTTIALVGDSHAAAMLPALDVFAQSQGWKVVTYLRTGCPALSEQPIALPGRTDAEKESCAMWSTAVLDELEADAIDTVIFTNFASRYADGAVPESDRLSSETVASTFERLVSAGKQVVVVRDIPDTHNVNIPACLGTSFVRSAPCSFARSTGLVDDVVQQAVSDSPAVGMVDLSDYFCDDVTCYAVIGDVVVYADENHVSDTFARTLAPYLGRELLNVIR